MEALAAALIRTLSTVVGTAKAGRTVPDPRSVRRIVVCQMSGVGDLLFMTPALRALHALYPAAGIDVITYNPSHAAFLFRLPYVRQHCRFRLFDIRLGRFWTSSFRKALEEPIRFLRDPVCDLFVGFHWSWLPQWTLLELWMAWRSSARFSIGVNPPEAGRRSVYDRFLPESRLGDRHCRDFFMDVVGLVGDGGKDLSMEFPLLPEEIEAARQRLRSTLPLCPKVVCLHPGATHAYQRWPVEAYVELATRLQAAGCGIVLVGTGQERSLTARIASALRADAVLDAAGTTSLFELGALIHASDLFIGNDSGPLHIAVARRRPAVGIVHRGSDPRFYRYHPEEAVIILDAGPSGWGMKDKEVIREWGISVDDVWSKVRTLLS